MALNEASVVIIKNKILEYEREFKARNGRKPSRDEINQDPTIRKYYKLYWKCRSNPTLDAASITGTKIKSPENIKPATPSIVKGTWATNLNKAPKSITTGDEALDRFNSLSSKLQQYNEKHYREEAESNKLFNYSLDFKRKHLLAKSKEVTEEIKIKRKSEKQNKADEHFSLTYEPAAPTSLEPTPEPHINFYVPSSPEPLPQAKLPAFTKNEPQPSALSLLESLANGSVSPTTTIERVPSFDFGNDFMLDNLNDYIKNSIIANDPLDNRQRANLSDNNERKKRIFDLEDESIYTVRKKLCSSANKFVSNSTSLEVPDLIADASDLFPSSPVQTSKSTRKFFKSRNHNDRVEYGPSNFFDHKKDSEFDFSNDNIPYEADNGNVPCKKIEKSKKLVNVTNNKDLTQSEKSEKAKAVVKKVKEKGNFRKLVMKKKGMSRGYKKFNMKRYKFKSWQKNKSYKKFDNKCFKCGEADHWANACPNNVSSLSTIDEGVLEQYDNHLNVDQTFDICLEEPLFTDIDDPELNQLVEESLTLFGFEEFRPNQKLTVKRILCSKSTLLISPTGFGKSLCYQLAAYCFWQKRRLITIVVSPLISLMQDQIANFPNVLKPVCLNSSMGDKEKESAINAIMYGQAQVLFLSPECVVNGLHSINFSAFSRVAFVCIDEAHCLAEWSTNFRPSYLHLYKVLRYKLNIKTILAMTATVTKDTSRIICKNLNLDSSLDVVGTTRVPDNLVLTIARKTNKLNALVELLKSDPFKSLRSIIIYCTKREQTTQLETQIRTLLQFDIPKSKVNNLVRAYHAGLGSYERTHIQEQFISGKLRIVVATIAFGMGINKPDIRGIIHYNMPKSFENYIQEIGRAGRDGQTAYCHLFIDKEGEDLFGLQNYIYANGIDKPSLRRLVAKIYQPCKCNLLAAADADSGLAIDSDIDSDRLICKGHPVALPIASTEIEIDLKSESIYTILMCLEQSWPEAPIHVHSPSNSTAMIVNFGEEENMYELVKQSAIMQMGATLAKQDCKDAFNFSNFKFSVVKVASMLGMEVNRVKSELKKLEWTTDPVTKRKKKSHVAIRFGDYSYMIRAPGNLEEEKIEEVVTFLADTIDQYESKEIYKLRFLYSKFSEFVLNDECPQTEDFHTIVANSNKLKHFINDYFGLDESILPSDLDTSKLTLPHNFDLQNQDIASIGLVICDFLHYHQGEGVNTPRKVARILQGISSPKYPAEIWGKVRRFWRCLPTIDFKDLMELCREGLISNYSL